ncbi:4-hydroybenzonate polyprenyltransferase [Formosa agariphila KMM 3901]|uniref:4-hydroybenzonate polyprenyltransferase n=1 Tax=Formosa agariphila (strain DSM 15362 / KCTC 12365 / LMG 23005 / KMM 3901 / M-2Alg 35-1) TaxID=1347342 RepID=T2KKQ5_FORAG|nr:geranylgeranylglycerol-phosphate geranylgeranyltransferase [Formosa agariphila]CDF79011.1 4-hydroybenzonate polyprenyltransferase [Formosa agariphila KMM 3901]
MKVLNLIRWKNLLLIILVQTLIKFALFPVFHVDTALQDWQFAILVLITLCLASAGNIINDIYDVETDQINKPNRVIIGKSISEQTAYILFIIFNVIGVGLGFYLSQAVGQNSFFALFVIISALLYLYASYLKRMCLIGNIIISILVALSLVIIGLFDLIPAITFENQYSQRMVFKLILGYAGMAFLLNFIREIVKDIEDIDGDYASGMHTLPILIGRSRATKVAFVFACFPLGIVIYYVITYLYSKPLEVGYFTFLIIGPLIFIVFELFGAKTKKDHRRISNALKLVMLTGVLSLLLYSI